MDTFIEKLITKRKTGKDRAFSAGIIALGIIVAYLVLNLTAAFLQSISLLLAAGVLYGTYLLVKSRNIEFEYAVTNGDLDIDRIVAQRKRKRIFSASCKDFEIVAKVSSDKFKQEGANIQKKIEAVSTLQNPDVYFIVLNYKGERTVVFFEPDKRMLDNFKTFIPRKVFAE